MVDNTKELYKAFQQVCVEDGISEEKNVVKLVSAAMGEMANCLALPRALEAVIHERGEKPGAELPRGTQGLDEVRLERRILEIFLKAADEADVLLDAYEAVYGKLDTGDELDELLEELGMKKIGRSGMQSPAEG
jgi:hypothetical protein